MKEKIIKETEEGIHENIIKTSVLIADDTLYTSENKTINFNSSLIYNQKNLSTFPSFEDSNELIEKVDDHIFINDNQLGVQKFDIKYATFDDPYINPLDLRLINYSKTQEELNNLITSVNNLEKTYLNLLSIKGDEIEIFFNNYSLCKYCANIYIIGLKRLLELALCILKTRFEPLEKAKIEKIVITNYLISDEIYINNFFNLSNFKEIAKNNNEKFLLFIDTFKLMKKNEDLIANFIKNEFVPSLSGIAFAVKSINNYIESTLKDCETLINEFNEEIVVELLLNVIKNNII